MDKAHLYYATDTYCVWCWGFGPALRTFAEQNADRLWVDVIPCSMLTGDRVKPLKDKERVKESAKRVGELCQVEFGDAFFDAVDEGNMAPDSGVAARLFCAAREMLGEERGLDIAHQLQHFFYWEGKDLNDGDVQREFASALKLDADTFMETLERPETEVARLAEVARRDTLPIKGYPTLLLEMPDGTHQRIGAPTSSPERLTQVVDAYLAGETPELTDDEEDDE